MIEVLTLVENTLLLTAQKIFCFIRGLVMVMNMETYVSCTGQ
ncbi:hypothetical protein SAMN05421736_101286 [Evansella caseinilytica]|uniref:Uncharacterized protein n=1 Tax=Evansella caseinilytica TaxID=1503961 RepID=A0A1H3GWT0_9BACI|nr:hypothetical protein SAMN05421736_101286 [Evansella caseinilytica]